MAATPTGLLSVPANDLRNLIADSSNWQSWCGVSSADAAKPFIHLFTIPEDLIAYPLACIWPGRYHRAATSASASAEFVFSSNEPTLTLLIMALCGSAVSITQTGGVATVTWPAHSIATGEYIEVGGANEPGYNTVTGPKAATVIDANTFTYSVPSATPATATGTVLCQPADESDLNVRFTNQLGAVLSDMENTPLFLRYHEIELVAGPSRSDLSERNARGDYMRAMFDIIHEGLA